MPTKTAAAMAIKLAWENRRRILAQCQRTWKRIWRRIKPKQEERTWIED